ncbi:NAD(P)/FAD-dependent oxidoreductase [Arthrobacter castelli]|uniref:NAD(P)/FAD-dependent oxidoreductase n=1 Tax=Arthrobacter castelli TaxID=271431 RepID=UPI00047B6C68|nr:FAD-dependent oxidoreductase [Arthrobacter castelli]
MAQSCDVLIVGGGIAGLSLAARLGNDMQVAVVEAESALAYHASSRSARQLQPSHGPLPIRTLTGRTIAAVEDISAHIGRRILNDRPLIFTGTEDDVAARLAASDVLQRISVDEALSRSPELRPEAVQAAALDDSALQVEADVLLDYYRDQALGAGVQIHCNAPVHTAQQVSAGWTVGAGEEAFHAGTVVNAAGAWADPLAIIFGVRILGLEPYRRTAAVVDTSRPVAEDGHMIRGADGSFYYRPEGTQLLISPCETVASQAEDAQPITADVDRLVERINSATTFSIKNIVRSWTGLRTEPGDGLPMVGYDEEAPDFFWLAGQGGYGIQTSWAMADLAASLITGSTTDADPVAKALSPLR